MEKHDIVPINSIDQAIEADQWAKSRAKEFLEKMVGK
jgi:hypothetical protein